MVRLGTVESRAPRAAALRALKFALVGVVGVGVNTAALYVLHEWEGLPLLEASALAVELAVINNYLLNNAWTFGAGRPTLRRFAKFNVSALGGLTVNTLAVWLLAGLGVFYLLANLIGITAAFAVNYVLSMVWVWRGST